MNKYSRQREEIKKAAAENLIHPTANDLYSIVKQVDPQISLGTVYRNLNLLVEQEAIQKISIPGGRDRFDANLTAHYHIICEKCGEVFDIEFDLLRALDEKIQDETGMKITAHQLIVYGICMKCQ